MKYPIKSLLACSVIGAAINLNAQTVTVDPSTLTLGYMNVFNVGGPVLGAAGEGANQFGSTWGVADLTSSFAGSTLTLGPNQIGDPNNYWYTPTGQAGAVGNKIMDANLYNESTGVYTGQTLTFSGDVLSSTLLNVGNVNAIGNGWTSIAFIKDFAPDYSSSVVSSTPIVNGVFNISLATINDPTRHIQYGFETIGPDVWATDVGLFGTIVVSPVPEPMTLSLAGLGGAAALALLRRRK